MKASAKARLESVKVEHHNTSGGVGRGFGAHLEEEIRL
jgi:hypothetical protein